MTLLFSILSVVLVLIILLFLVALRIKFIFNTDNSQMYITLFWLNPFVNAFINIENTVPVVKIYIFKQLIFTKELKRGKNKHGGMELVKISNPKDIHVNVSYGFKDPFTTGIVCVVMNIASQIVNIDSINYTPDFIPSNDYICLDATAKVNVGTTLINLIRSKKWLQKLRLQ